MSENLDNSEEITHLEARLKDWEARSETLYDGLKFKKFKTWIEAQSAKEQIYSIHMTEYEEIKNQLEELGSNAFAKIDLDKARPSQSNKTNFGKGFSSDFISKVFFIFVGVLALWLVSLVAEPLGMDASDDPVDLIWWAFWAIVIIVGFLAVPLGIYDYWKKRKKG